ETASEWSGSEGRHRGAPKHGFEASSGGTTGTLRLEFDPPDLLVEIKHIAVVVEAADHAPDTETSWDTIGICARDCFHRVFGFVNPGTGPRVITSIILGPKVSPAINRSEIEFLTSLCIEANNYRFSKHGFRSQGRDGTRRPKRRRMALTAGRGGAELRLPRL